MRAIVSVSDKTGLAELGLGLTRLGVELVSTGGTARALAAAGLAVVSVSDVTGFPEMLDGRVKTLHPAVFGGILARRARPDDLAAIAAQRIAPVDLVVVNLYPFAKAAQDPDLPFDALVEEIDIGGPSLLRAGAKNFRDVLVVVDPADYPRVLDELARPGGPSLAFRFELMKKTFAHTAEFDALIAQTMDTIACNGTDFVRQGGGPATYRSVAVASRPLRYGENPHQQAEWGPLPRGLGEWQVHQGKELSYTNLLDLDAALRIAVEFSEPAAVVIKHTNPCGVATGTTIAAAYVAARDADAVSAFGGIVGLNQPIDADTAAAIASTFVEAVIAPSIEEGARAILSKKGNMRVLTTDFGGVREGRRREMRSMLGGILTQDADSVSEAHMQWPPPSPDSTSPASARQVPPSPDSISPASEAQMPTIRVVTKRQPTADQWVALRFAWRVCAHVKSNAVIFTGADRTLAIGAGQMSRVDAVKVAVMKATGPLAGSVAASDAFFPFRDGLDAVAEAGATAVVQPGGSVRDAEVIAAADERGLAMVFTGRRHFRH
jgi:phosphoribosylaminoimidazolecarboxamide formyltransferase / IMP cyclohydrolase